jgi:pyridoxal phosphate enzyme (YggS family)
MIDVAGNYRRIIERINDAAARAGRRPDAVRLLAAAKSQDIELVRAALNAGVSLIGENYVQEAQEKKAKIAGSVEWHMIGHLQRNKAKAAVLLFDVIESLDSVALARELDREGGKKGAKVRAYIEVNLGGEASKSGILPSGLPELVEAVGELSHLHITGLMVVPPMSDDPDEARPYFCELRELREKLNARKIPNVDIRELSMGMTHDYSVAVEEGATIVRIGTALFGPRSR